MANRLYRSTSDKVLGGVCAGLGSFLRIDPVFIRIFFIVWTIFGEFAVLVYILLWVIVPVDSKMETEEPFQLNNLGTRFQQMGQEVAEVARQPNSELIIFTGIGLIAWGVYYFIRRWLPYLNLWEYSHYIWPAMLIAAGVLVIIRTSRREE